MPERTTVGGLWPGWATTGCSRASSESAFAVVGTSKCQVVALLGNNSITKRLLPSLAPPVAYFVPCRCLSWQNRFNYLTISYFRVYFQAYGREIQGIRDDPRGVITLFLNLGNRCLERELVGASNL